MLSSFFNNSVLKPKWKFVADGIVWRIHFSNSNFIVGEDRNIDKKKTTFFCINATNGAILWKNIVILDDWWVGIEKVTDDKIFFHGFGKPDMPEHKKVFMVDLGTGKLIWKNEDYTFYTGNNNFIYVFKDYFERRVYYKINSSNGEILEEITDLTDEIIMSTENENIANLIYPSVLTDLENFTFQDEIKNITNGEKIVGAIEYVLLDDKIIFNYHKQKDKLLENKLFIIKKEGKKLFEEIILKESEYPAPDSFFVQNNLLYFIKNRNTLTALNLNLN